jgi:CRISPR-associated Csx10 family RAMP protein
LEKREKGRGETPFSFKGMSPGTTSYVHIGISPDRGASAQEIFYTIDALDEEQFFLGTILIDDQLQEWLNILNPLEYLFLGGSKSRGYGAGRIEVIQMEPEVTANGTEGTKGEGYPLQPPDRRCQIFTERIREKGGFIEEGSWLVPFTLLSPSILMDRFLRPVADDITKDVRDHGLPTTGKPILVKARMQTVQGWHSASNVPKPDFLAIASGSIFVYQCPATEQTVHALHRIEEMGIGFRRAEGFGQVRVASPLHTGLLAGGGQN